MISESQASEKLHKNEGIKERSNFLRGTILEGLDNVSTGAISAEDQQITKFHGIYQQDDRDVRSERRKHKLDKAYSFMARIGLPGGVCTPEQWLTMDDASEYCAFKTLKLTTRQAFQLHGVLKANLRSTIRVINDAAMTTLAACGDVNRNTMANPDPASPAHDQVQPVVEAVDKRLKPQTSAYAELWLDGEPLATHGSDNEEPIYGATYLPRKFKIAFATPPVNDVDVFAHCLGFIAIVEDGELQGFNVTVGGGMGMTHGKEKTFPRLANVMAFCKPDQVVDVAENIVGIQRDYGDRVDRTHARFKYTVDDHGVDWIRSELENRLGYALQAPRPYAFEKTGDAYGWRQAPDGTWSLCLFIEGGRIVDQGERTLKTGMREIARVHQGDFRLTPNQNLVIAGVAEENRGRIDELVAKHGLDAYKTVNGLRRNQISCVALPTCGLALSESERYLPSLVGDLESTLEEAGLENDDIIIRSTGCPNGCARPYLGEIGLVGKVPGKYNLYLGAGFNGERLNKLYRESLTHDAILETLRPILFHYAKEREDGERFGDFVIRTGYVEATREGRDFHANLPEAVAGGK